MKLSDKILRSERFVVVVQVGTSHRTIFQLQFQRADGSVFVHFPYSSHAKGLLSCATLAAGSPNGQLKLQEGGKATSHRVKYSHHPDGQVLFSQDGRVRSEIRRQGVPLDQVEGHFFTVEARGLGQFATPTRKHERARVPNPSGTTLTFTMSDGEPDAVKVVGRMYPFREQEGPEDPSAPVVLQRSDGQLQPAFVCSAPLGRPGEDRIVLLSCEPIQYAGSESSLLFLGGFDPPAIVADLSQPMGVLAFTYPANGWEDLERRLGSVDFHRNSEGRAGG
jgi:hypothetical protein